MEATLESVRVTLHHRIVRHPRRSDCKEDMHARTLERRDRLACGERGRAVVSTCMHARTLERRDRLSPASDPEATCGERGWRAVMSTCFRSRGDLKLKGSLHRDGAEHLHTHAIAAVISGRSCTRVSWHAMSVVISDHPVQSNAGQSRHAIAVVISDHLVQSNTGQCNPVQSSALQGNQVQSIAIQCTPGQSSAIKYNPVHSSAINGNQVQSMAIKSPAHAEQSRRYSRPLRRKLRVRWPWAAVSGGGAGATRAAAKAARKAAAAAAAATTAGRNGKWSAKHRSCGNWWRTHNHSSREGRSKRGRRTARHRPRILGGW